MKLTRIDRMERIEHIIQSKIEQTEKDLDSLKRMPDPEICRIRRMYEMNLSELQRNRDCLRRKIDLEKIIAKARFERDYEGRTLPLGRMLTGEAKDNENDEGDENGEDDEEGGTAEGGGNEPCDEADMQRGGQEPGSRGGCRSGVHDVGRDDGDAEGDHAGDRKRRTRVRRWQIEAMVHEVTEL